MRSLQKKLTIPTTIIILIGVILISLIGYNISKNMLIKDMNQISTNNLEKLVDITNYKIEKWQTILKIIASTDVAKKMDLNEFSNFTSLRKDLYSEFEFVLIANDKGIYRSSQNTGGSLADNDFFKKTLEGADIISDPYLEPANGVYVVFLSTPVRANDGRVIGAVCATLELNKITELINNDKSIKNENAIMINKTGLVIAHPKKSSIMKENLLTQKDTELSKLTQTMLEGKPGIKTYSDEKGDKKLYVFSSIKATGWPIAVIIPYSSIVKDVDVLRVWFSVVGIIVIIITGLFMYIFVGYFIKPINNMAKTASIIASGNLSINDINVNSKDEVKILADSFNNMKNGIKNIVKNVNEIAATVFSSARDLNRSVQMNFETSNQVLKAIVHIANSAENNVFEISNLSNRLNAMESKISKIAAISERLMKSTSLNSARNTEVEKDISTINKAILNLQLDLLEVNKSGKDVYDLVENYASLSEEIANSSEDQKTNLKKMIGTADVLDGNVEKLEQLISKFIII
jgi:methyl-accepting chemotaxis protein